MNDADNDKLGSPPELGANPEPQVLAIKRDGSVWRMGKRAFLKTAAAATVAGATVGCSDPKKDPDNVIPPFVFGSTTYRLIDLKDYNGALPPSGTNLAVVAYVQSDFYFRYFDAQGQLAVNQHESNILERANIAQIKVLAASIAAKGEADPVEQTRFAVLFSEVRADAAKSENSSGRRMQGSDGRVKARGRRMQGSAGTGAVSGRRMQGAEGRVEAGSPQRNLGTLRINNEYYTDSRIEASYTDGYTKLAHTGGTVMVRTDALPEIVRLQLPHPIDNPSQRPSAVPHKAVVPEPSPPRPSPPPRPPPRPKPSPSPGGGSGGEYTSHYWRPN